MRVWSSGRRADRADIVRLLLLTDCRSGEFRNLQWQEEGEKGLALSDSKTGYLNRDAKALIARQPRLESADVLPSVRDRSRPCPEHSLWNFWCMARERAGSEDARLHDLRHSHASRVVTKGIPLPAISRPRLKGSDTRPPRCAAFRAPEPGIPSGFRPTDRLKLQSHLNRATGLSDKAEPPQSDSAKRS